MKRAPSATDGRAARGARARAAIIDAMLALLEEGNLKPTTQQVSERAQVSLRLVFHHFRDMEALFTEASAKFFETRISPLLRPPVTEGPLSERLAAFVSQRVLLYETVGPVRRSAESMEPFSPAIGEWMQRGRLANAIEAAEHFGPELDALPPDLGQKVTAALSMLTSFAAWESLRLHQGLSREEAAEVLAETLRRLLRPA